MIIFYLKNFVIVQSNIMGYSDEAKIYGNYLEINFNEIDKSVSKIVNLKSSNLFTCSNIKPFS